jgi:hypothetical protein
LSGRILRRIGVKRSLMLGQATQVVEQLAAGLATKGIHFYLLRPFRITADVGELAMQYTTTSIGAELKIPQGELQAALSSISKLVGIVTPLLWGQLYAYGVAAGIPSLFYYASAAGGVLQLLMLRVLLSMKWITLLGFVHCVTNTDHIPASSFSNYSKSITASTPAWPTRSLASSGLVQIWAQGKDNRAVAFVVSVVPRKHHVLDGPRIVLEQSNLRELRFDTEWPQRGSSIGCAQHAAWPTVATRWQKSHVKHRPAHKWPHELVWC